MSRVHAVLDTNTFLHYVDIDQFDWSVLFPGKQVRLVICSPVLRELNKHKDTPRTSRLRERASSALKRIDQWADSSSEVLLRPNVTLDFLVNEASVDFARHNLVREIADDHLIATLLQLHINFADDAVALVTRDTGLKLKARAAGFIVATMPDSASLPEELLADEKRIKALELQVRELQNTRPRLKLLFSGQSVHHELNFQRTKRLSPKQIAEKLSALKNKYPKIVAKVKTKPQESSPSFLGSTSRLAEIEPQAIDTYNENLDRFFSECTDYFEALAAFYRWESLTAPLDLVLVNDGSSPADDIDIFMHFPDGFELLEEHEYKTEPLAPEAPAKPKSIFELAIGGLAAPNFAYANDHLLTDMNRFHLPTGPANVSGPNIKRTNSYDVNVHVRRAKHGIEVSLDKMYVKFESSAAVNGFAIDYVIHASNLPAHVSGKVNISVQAKS